MPIKPAPRNISETEYMLSLLRCVEVLDCLTDVALWTFVAELDLMDYVTMRLCLHKLLSAEELEYGAGTMKNHLYLTEKGREALALFGQRLPSAVTERIAEAEPAFRKRLTTNQQVRAVYDMAMHNDYRISFSVTEGDLTMLVIRMRVKSRRIASRAMKQFEAQAAQTVMYLYQLAQDAQSLQVSDAKQSGEVVRHSSTEFSAKHALENKRVEFDIMLTLPSEEAAKAYLRYFQDTAAAEAVTDKLYKLICGMHIRS